jgi:GxxExxY protein
MPYEDEDPNYTSLGEELNSLTERIIGALIEVHRRLVAGLDEALYERAICIELAQRGVPFERQVIVTVRYKGQEIGEKRLDFVVDGKVIVEIKAIGELAPVHKSQVLTYLRITGLRLGLLVNFNTPLLSKGIQRIINSKGGIVE